MTVSVRIHADRSSNSFVDQVEHLSGQRLLACYQCGNCSAGCPMSGHMEILPNQIVRMAQLGMRDTLCESKAIWACVSCMTCNTRCPKGVRIAEVIEAVREIVLRSNRRDDRLQVGNLSTEFIGALPPIALISGMRKLTS